MSAMVWVLMLYSAFTVTALTMTEGIPVTLGMVYAVLVFMSLASHAKTSFTDPGSVPVQAIPSERQRLLRDSHSMCGQCQTFKPPGSHHCRICNRCISRMDHHCPWMNNCVGAGNLKHFCLFLIYTWLCAAYSLSVFGWNYFFCSDEDCTFHPLVLHLVRLMTLLAVGAFLFTSSMLMNVCYGIMTGIGTIDRLKKKATNTMSQSDEEPIQLIDVFGIGGFWTWILPIDPIFDEHDRVMGYTLPSRLDRERQFCELVSQQQQQQTNGTGDMTGSIKANNSMDYPGKCVNDLLPV
jgi:palmitoyltransferase ZDHHC3/7/25